MTKADDGWWLDEDDDGGKRMMDEGKKGLRKQGCADASFFLGCRAGA
jgi:hypothetical protein